MGDPETELADYIAKCRAMHESHVAPTPMFAHAVAALADKLEEAEAMQATPHIELIAQIMSSVAPKNEREWAASREIERLRAELDTERMRLAACGVVAMADTPESAAEARNMHPDYRSASCDDVARRVDECIRLRAQVETLDWQLAMESIDTTCHCARVTDLESDLAAKAELIEMLLAEKRASDVPNP